MLTYDSADGGTIFLEDEKSLGAGGRGNVFPVLFDSAHDATGRKIDLACKVLAEGYRSEGRRRKVEALARMRNRAEICAAWPVSSIYDEGAWAGFTMYRLAGSSLDAVVADPATGLSMRNRAEICAAWPVSSIYDEGAWAGFTMYRLAGSSLDAVVADPATGLSQRVDMAVRACDIVAGMHRLGVVIGDVNMANFMYDAAADRLGLVDLDSVQIIDEAEGVVFPVVESLEKSPEMLEAGLGKAPLTSRSDDFLVAVMVFRMLFGVHPLDSFETDRLPAEVRAENALARRFPYSAQHGVLPENAFGDDLALLFRRSFKGPYERVPGTEEYRDALRALLATGFARCAHCGTERPRSARTCPACRKRKKEAFMGGKLFRAAALLGVVVVASQVVDPAQLLDGRSARTCPACRKRKKEAFMGGKLFRAAALLGVVVVASQVVDPAQLLDGAGALAERGADVALEAIAGAFASLEDAWDGLIVGAIGAIEEGLTALSEMLL